MKKGMKLELYRAFHNPEFFIALAGGCIIAMIHFIHQVLPGTAYIFSGINMDYPKSVFRSTLMLDFISFYANVYYYAVPLLIVLPFGVSYYQDMKSGYIKNVCIRMDKKAYMAGKYVAVFLSAGTVCICPLILNLMLTMTVLPSLIPQLGTSLFGVMSFSFMSELFYSHPFVYLARYLVLDFIMCGALACMALGVSTLVHNYYIVLFAPFGIFFLLQAVCGYSGYSNWNPYNILCPVGNAAVSLHTVLIETTAFLLIGAGSFALEGRRKDVL